MLQSRRRVDLTDSSDCVQPGAGWDRGARVHALAVKPFLAISLFIRILLARPLLRGQERCHQGEEHCCTGESHTCDLCIVCRFGDFCYADATQYVRAINALASRARQQAMSHRSPKITPSRSWLVVSRASAKRSRQTPSVEFSALVPKSLDQGVQTRKSLCATS